MATATGVQASSAGAAVYPAAGGDVYKEYWLPHTNFTGGCPDHHLEKPGDTWYIEVSPCTKTIPFTIADDVSRAAKVEIYLDLWRNYAGVNAARFQINGGPVRQPMVAQHYSRTPWITEIPASELRQGANTITFLPSPKGHRYHVHDIAFRVHQTAAQPIIAGPGSDVTPPSASLTAITAANGTFSPATGGALDVSNDALSFAADSTDAKVVEFHAFYEGYDTDNDGQTRDWHAFNRNNWNPGGQPGKFKAPATGATLGIPGADATAPYAITWKLPQVVNQDGVRFKVRAVDAAGNVRETVASAPFSLQRSFDTSAVRIADFKDIGIHLDGFQPRQTSVTMTVPSLEGVTSAYLVGHYWQNPFVSLNGSPQFLAFQGTEDVWNTSVREIPLSSLRAGANTITYSYNPLQISFGQFVEKPGPMLVLRGGAAEEPTPLSIDAQPQPVSVVVGHPATFSVAVSGGEGSVSYQWRRDGVPVAGATSANLTLPTTTDGDDGASFDVLVSAGTASLTSSPAVLSVSATEPPPSTTAPVATLTGGRVNETNTTAGVSLAFKITLDKPAPVPVTLVLATNGTGSATVGQDYAARPPATVTIPAGAKVAWFGVKVKGDLTREPNETLGVAIVSADGASIGTGSALGTIVNDD